MVNDGGIVGALDARTGEQRLPRARRGDLLGIAALSPPAASTSSAKMARPRCSTAASEFKVMAENFLEDGFMASPAVDGKALFLRTRTHVYRIEEP